MPRLMLADLIGPVKQASRVAAKGRAAFLKGVWLRFLGDALIVSASDGSTEYECRLPLPATAGEELRFGVDGALLSGLLGRMGQGEVDVALGEGQVVLSQGRRRFELAVMEGYWATETAAFPEGEGFFISGTELSAIIGSVEFCAMTDETMGALACVLIDRNGDDRAAAVALNGHQLAVHRFAVSGVVSALPEMGLKVRRTAWPDVRAWMDGREIEARIDDKRLHLRDAAATERWVLPMTLAEYPQWQELLAKTGDGGQEITVNRYALTETLERLRMLCSESVIAAHWEMDDQIATMRVAADGRGKGEDYVGIVRTGDLDKIALPVADLIDVLKRFQGDEVRMVFSGREGPCVISDKNAGDEYAVLIMPMKVGEEVDGMMNDEL